MREDLSGPYPGYGLGALDAFDGYVSYRMLSETELTHVMACSSSVPGELL